MIIISFYINNVRYVHTNWNGIKLQEIVPSLFQIIWSLQKVMVIPSIYHSIYSLKDHIDFLSFIDNIAYTRYLIITRVVISHAYMATDM